MESAEGDVLPTPDTITDPIDPIIKVMKFKHGSIDMPYSMRTSGSSDVAEVTPNDCTWQYVCSIASSGYGPCTQCRDDLNANGCITAQVNYAIAGAQSMYCCY